MVRERTTGLFFASLDRWTRKPEEGYVFRTVESAMRFCQYHAIPNASVVTCSETGDVQVVRKVIGAQTRRHRGRPSR